MVKSLLWLGWVPGVMRVTVEEVSGHSVDATPSKTGAAVVSAGKRSIKQRYQAVNLGAAAPPVETKANNGK
ncbi:MAG: hypothetical protein WCP96_11505 [Methylococcaceae bacterium]